MILTSRNDREEQEFGRKAPYKAENFPTRNTALMKSPEFPVPDLFLAVLSDLGFFFRLLLLMTMMMILFHF
jgi:hypothetical protein